MNQQNSIALYELNYRELKTYLMAALFVAGNIALPQLCHLMPQGGLFFLPIYFFTLVGAYKYGLTVGLLTAVFSPLVNSLLFGMPSTAMLLPILTKSVVLALAASYVAHRSKDVSLLSILLVVVIYQLVGSLAEWAITGSLQAALQDVRLGIPGILIQVIGGWAVLRYLLKK